MPVPKIDANAQNIARILATAGVDLSQVPPAANGEHTRESLTALMVDGIKTAIEARRPNSNVPTMTPEQAWRSGRLADAGLPSWEARYKADPVAVGRTLATLYPILAQSPGGGPTSSTSSTPDAGLSAAEQLDIIDDEMWGEGHSEMSRNRRRVREDEQVLTEYQAALAAQEAAAAETLTAEEYRAIFGQDEPKD